MACQAADCESWAEGEYDTLILLTAVAIRMMPGEQGIGDTTTSVDKTRDATYYCMPLRRLLLKTVKTHEVRDLIFEGGSPQKPS